MNSFKMRHLIYEKLGIDLSTAVQMFLKRSVLDNGIPFKMTLPKEEYKISQAENALDKIIPLLNKEILDEYRKVLASGGSV